MSATLAPARSAPDPSPDAAPLIRMAGVGKTYHAAGGATVRALAGVDLDIADGAFVSVVGPSGCGKSTLLRMLAGLDRCEEGSLRLGGRDVRGPSGEVGVVFQAANLLPWMTVRENIRLPLRVGGRHAPAEARIDALLEVTGLADFGARYPYELSGGMQQRAGICRALVRDPRILLMDEPFGALDALTRERMNAELQRIWQTSGKTVLLITHSISEAIFLADQVVVMSPRPGRVLRVLEVPIPRPRSFDSIVSHPAYAGLAREIRALLTEPGDAP
jgi:NitT/TauT family transport system ATP-binding protein